MARRRRSPGLAAHTSGGPGTPSTARGHSAEVFAELDRREEERAAKASARNPLAEAIREAKEKASFSGEIQRILPNWWVVGEGLMEDEPTVAFVYPAGKVVYTELGELKRKAAAVLADPKQRAKVERAMKPKAKRKPRAKRRVSTGPHEIDQIRLVKQLAERMGPLVITSEGEENIYFTDATGTRHFFKHGGSEASRSAFFKATGARTVASHGYGEEGPNALAGAPGWRKPTAKPRRKPAAKPKPRWVPGRGPQAKQGDFKTFKKKGTSYYKDASWAFMKKNAPKLRIVVSWNPSGRGDDWQRQEFTPDDLRTAKNFAKVTAEEGWAAEVFGEAYGWRSTGGMDMVRVFDFGRYALIPNT